MGATNLPWGLDDAVLRYTLPSPSSSAADSVDCPGYGCGCEYGYGCGYEYGCGYWCGLIDMCLVDCYDEMGRVLCRISDDDWLTTDDSNPSLLASDELTTAANTTPSRSTSEDISYSRSDSEEFSNSGSLLARMRRHITVTPDTVFENHRTSKNIALYQATATTVKTIKVDKSG